MTELRKRLLETVTNLKEDDGNPSLFQALNYDIDNDEIGHDEKLHSELFELVDQLANIRDKFDQLSKKYNNKKIEKIADLVTNVICELYEQGMDKDKLDYNRYRMKDLSNINPDTGELEYSYMDKQNTDYYNTPYGGFDSPYRPKDYGK